jgi:hypothetical protein
VPLKYIHISDLRPFETWPKHLARVLPGGAFVDEDTVPKVRRHLLNAFLTQAPRIGICRKNSFDVLRVIGSEKLITEDIVVSSVLIYFFEVFGHVWKQAVLFYGFDLLPPEERAESERCLAPLRWQAAVLFGEDAET